MDYNQLSCIEIVVKLLEEKGEPTEILSLIKEALALKGIDDTDGSFTTRLYTDITTSSKFVFCGEGKWDLKKNQPLETFDRDGSYWGIKIEDDEEDDINVSDYNIDDNEDEDDDDEEKDEEDVDLYDEDEEDDDIIPIEDDEDDKDYIDEDKYNALMDDYEDMYDKD